MTTEYRTANS